MTFCFHSINHLQATFITLSYIFSPLIFSHLQPSLLCHTFSPFTSSCLQPTCHHPYPNHASAPTLHNFLGFAMCLFKFLEVRLIKNFCSFPVDTLLSQVSAFMMLLNFLLYFLYLVSLSCEFPSIVQHASS